MKKTIFRKVVEKSTNNPENKLYQSDIKTNKYTVYKYPTFKGGYIRDNSNYDEIVTVETYDKELDILLLNVCMRIIEGYEKGYKIVLEEK